MQSNAPALNWGRLITQGVLAGVVGAIALAAATYVVTGLPHHLSIAGVFLSYASLVHSDNAWVGGLAHLLVSIGWGIGYAYVAATRPNVASSPWLSGLVYGCIVWLLMQFVLMLGDVWPGITLVGFLQQIFVHTVFYGLPVALTVRAASRT